MHLLATIIIAFLNSRTASCRRGEPLSVNTETLLYHSTRANTTPSYLMKHQIDNRSSSWRRNPCHHTNGFSDRKCGFSFPCLAPLCVRQLRIVNFLHPYWASLRGSQRLVVTGILHTELLPFPALHLVRFCKRPIRRWYPYIRSSISVAVAFNKGVTVHPYLQSTRAHATPLVLG